MYSRGLFKKVRHVVSKVVSTDSTTIDSTSLVPAAIGSVTGRLLGQNFSVTVWPMGGPIYASVESTVNPTTDSFRLSTDHPFEVKLNVGLRLLGSSTDVSVKAIVWED